MPEITETTPRRDILIGGVILSAPTPFAAGHVLIEGEAAALNQTYLENIGNNTRAAVNKAKKLAILGKSDPTADELKSVTDDQIKAFDKRLEDDADFRTKFTGAAGLQAMLDKVVSEYKMGVRRTSSVEVVDPVTKEARAMAKARLNKALQNRNVKLNTVSKDWYDREVPKLLDKENPKISNGKNITEEIWAAAQQIVDQRKAAAGEALDDLDLGGVEKKGEPQQEGSGEGQDPNAGTDQAAGTEASAKPNRNRK